MKKYIISGGIGKDIKTQVEVELTEKAKDDLKGFFNEIMEMSEVSLSLTPAPKPKTIEVMKDGRLIEVEVPFKQISAISATRNHYSIVTYGVELEYKDGRVRELWCNSEYDSEYEAHALGNELSKYLEE